VRQSIICALVAVASVAALACTGLIQAGPDSLGEAGVEPGDASLSEAGVGSWDASPRDASRTAHDGADGSVAPPDGTAATRDVAAAACGDQTCDPGETCATCPADCGACPPTCPNGTCDPGETCATCPADCGACDEADVLSKCASDPMQWWRGDGSARDITFAAVGDVHAMDPAAGCDVNDSAGPNQNGLLRQAINSADAQPHVWPSGPGFYREGQVYDHIRGLIIAGDLTQAGSRSIPAGTQPCREYTAYRDAFGRCGTEGRLRFPVYEGYGNHDFPRWPSPGDINNHPVIDYLDRIAAGHRPGAASDLYDDTTAGTGHYAWRWDDIWFVQLNLKPGSTEEYIPTTGLMRIADPHGSRRFLKEFLLSRGSSSSRQIVLVAHYPIYSDRISDDERSSLCQLIYNAQHASGDFSGAGQKLATTWPVIAYLHGHTHSRPDPHDHPYPCPSPYGSVEIPEFSVGTPLYGGTQNLPGQMHFTIMRIGSTTLEVVGVSAPAENPAGGWTYVYKQRYGYPLPP